MSIYRKSFFDIALDQGLWILQKKKILQHSTRSVDLDNQRLKDGDLLKGRAHLIGLVIRLESKNDVNTISDKTSDIQRL